MIAARAAWVLGLVSLIACPRPGRAQLVDQYFQSSVPGFNEERGVTVLARPRPLLEEPGINVDGVTVRPDLDESVQYNSNVDALPGGPGSWVVETAPSLALSTKGSRATVATVLTLQDYRYIELPRQSRTDWTASLGVTYALGHDDALTLAYAHLNEHQTAAELASIASTTPVPFQSDDLRASYRIRVGRLILTPGLEYTTFQFGAATSTLGQAANARLQDYSVLTGGVTALYPLGINRSVVLVVQDVETDYQAPPPGLPDSSARSLIVLGGLDYQSSGVFRYRLLAGLERRSFVTGDFPVTTTPILEAGVVWTPTGLTTITATASRRIEEATTPGLGSYTYTSTRVLVDHELRHDVLLQGRAVFQLAQYASGGSQTSFGLGAGVAWLLGRHMRLRLDYDYVRQGAISGGPAPVPGSPTALVSGSYEQSVIALTLHLAL